MQNQLTKEWLFIYILRFRIGCDQIRTLVFTWLVKSSAFYMNTCHTEDFFGEKEADLQLVWNKKSVLV